MENFDKFPYFSNEDVKIIAYCPFCDADLNPVKARIIETNEDMQLVHIQCNKCSTFILALLMKTANGLTSVGMITDLNFNDVAKFKEVSSLSADQIINLHKTFSKKDISQKLLEISKY